MKFKNLTRNKLTIHGINGVVEIDPEPIPAFCRVWQEPVFIESGIEVVESRFGEINLPDEMPGVGLIVSKVAAEAAMIQSNGERGDIYIPSGQIKDRNGTIIGCRALERVQ